MYGFVNSALEKLVLRRFGREKWEEIRQRANLQLGDSNTFLINHVYKDQETYVVVGAACEILGLEPGTILEMFGEQFLVWCKESGYAQTLQRLGRSLQDFLTNLDALHDHLSIIYPQMDAPSFRCSETSSKKEFHLHYYSSRDGLERIVIGIVKSVAREFYGVEVEITLIRSKEDGLDHALFRIREIAYYDRNTASLSPVQVDYSPAAYDRQLISARSFCKSFPFHIIFDHDMKILQVGASLAWVIPGWNIPDKYLTTFFALERPRMKLSFKNILSHINTIFIIRLSQVTAAGLAYSGSTSDPMRLRGQMIHLPESSSMLFLCSPRVSSIQDLEQRSLYLSDIPIHDATRSLLMMSQAARSEFTHVVQLEELIGQLNAAQTLLEEEKARMNDLIHEMLPGSVADSLLAGQVIEAERFESVTILFSDIVGFTRIAQKSHPMQIVNMLNKLYTLFDQVVGNNGVYKVETIGDAYMVVGGLPERNTVHAECVANQALDMMHYCKQVIEPDSDPEEPIKMRIGIHSGEVVAGVVGRKMPRYCLFGNTVNVASRTESNGVPTKIQVTEVTYNLLKDKPNFVFNARGPIEFKNVKKPMMCYILEDNTSKVQYMPLNTEEEEQQYAFSEFRLSSGTPPTTPFMPAMTPSEPPDKVFPSIAVAMSHTSSLLAPNIEVTDPTPESSPHPSPPLLQCPFTMAQPTPPPSRPVYSSPPLANWKPQPVSGGLPEEEEPVRKLSVESYGSRETTSSMTASESDTWSEDGHTSVGDIHTKLEPISETNFSLNTVQEAIRKLENNQERDDKVEILVTNGDVNTGTAPPPTSPSRDSDRERRSISTLSNQSMTSEESHSGEEDGSPNKRGTRYVRPRSTSIKELQNIFEGRGRRTGLSTTNYIPPTD